MLLKILKDAWCVKVFFLFYFYIKFNRWIVVTGP